ncbi:cytochrome b/b6 domain-containing protein [Ferrimonas aestuarii]|uniref:Cytochrome b/b6 domain-containing protein n=1 Tax=Ferrimonas aestuarii TaxID=2569539 RepID=A0A4U1BQP0_9GAMM|nr:cytochrome b/b6 domain-containing protein [Ferrimonas aestuarii]TKB57381.1 cytochrome b/b6 domain-containing protein [Ferrimonas aestuarii]
MSTLFERLHLLVAALTIWLVATGDKLTLANRISSRAGFWEYQHLILGTLTAVLCLMFVYRCCQQGQWRLYASPWLQGLKPVWRDLVGLSKRQLPAAGTPGLLTFIESLGLVLMLMVSVTGLLWWLTMGSSMAMELRAVHIHCASLLVYFLILHAVASVSHLLEIMK